MLELALDPDHVDRIPANVSARLLPKTLFGERYVALQLPEPTRAARSTEGDVIGQDRSSIAPSRCEQVLDNLMPLLQAVQPEKLSSTLNAVSTALDGRGKQFGETLVQLGDYLGELNAVAAGRCRADITAARRGRDTYAEAAPGPAARAARPDHHDADAGGPAGEPARTCTRTLTTASVDLRASCAVNKDNLIRLTSAAPVDAGRAGEVRARVPVPAQAAGRRRSRRRTRRSARAPTTRTSAGSPSSSPPAAASTCPAWTSRSTTTNAARAATRWPSRPAPFPQYPPGGADRGRVVASRRRRESDRPEDFQPTRCRSRRTAPDRRTRPAERELIAACSRRRSG